MGGWEDEVSTLNLNFGFETWVGEDDLGKRWNWGVLSRARPFFHTPPSSRPKHRSGF